MKNGDFPIKFKKQCCRFFTRLFLGHLAKSLQAFNITDLYGVEFFDACVAIFTTPFPGKMSR